RGVAAERDLIGFLALFFEPENADGADVVMTAGVDAARDFYAEPADEALALRVFEAARNRLRDGDRASGRQRAIIEAGAANNIGQQPRIGGGEPGRVERPPQRVEVVLLDMRQD